MQNIVTKIFKFRKSYKRNSFEEWWEWAWRLAQTSMVDFHQLPIRPPFDRT